MRCHRRTDHIKRLPPLTSICVAEIQAFSVQFTVQKALAWHSVWSLGKRELLCSRRQNVLYYCRLCVGFILVHRGFPITFQSHPAVKLSLLFPNLSTCLSEYHLPLKSGEAFTRQRYRAPC